MKTNQSTALGIDKSTQRNVEIISNTCSSGQNYWTIQTFCVFSSIFTSINVPSLWLLVDMKAPHWCEWLLSTSSAAVEGRGDRTLTPDLLNQSPLRRWELMSLSCHVWQALICFHSASHHGFKDEWIIQPRGRKKISVPPKKWLVSKNCWPEANYFS